MSEFIAADLQHKPVKLCETRRLLVNCRCEVCAASPNNEVQMFHQASP